MSNLSLEKTLCSMGLGPEDLDELVHEAASNMASNANNEGMRGQISFLMLIAGWSEAEVLSEFTSTLQKSFQSP